MKGAVEFLKKYGINDAKQLVSMGCGTCEIDDGILFHTSDLKRLIESHELVESYGGLEDAKKELQRQSILRWVNPETEILRSAIADVESCQ